MKILVTGATGLVGRQVVDQLLEAGVTVRALTRDPAAAALPAQVGVPGRPDGARDRGAGAGRRRPALPVPGAGHRGGGRRAGQAGRRPSASAIRAERVVRYPFADQVGVPVHEADVAAVAVAALLEDGHAGNVYTLSGPARVTYREQVEAIGAALGSEVRYEEVSREEARDLLKAQGGIAATNAHFLLGFVDYGGGDSTEAADEPDYSALLKPWPATTSKTSASAGPHPSSTPSGCR